ncbi:hypothetical protein ACFX2I_024525 [Malus domestica]
MILFMEKNVFSGFTGVPHNVVPRGFREARMRESKPRPNARKLQGAWDLRTWKDTPISFRDCCVVWRDVA